MFVIPREGYTVRDPFTKRALPAGGADVRNSVYWQRRLRDGDVTRASVPSTTAQEAKSPITGEMLTGAQITASAEAETVKS